MEGSIAVSILFLVLAVCLIFGVRHIAVTASRQRREYEEKRAWRQEENAQMRRLSELVEAFAVIKEEFDAYCEGMDEDEQTALWSSVDKKISSVHVTLIESGFAAAVPLQIQANEEARKVLAERKAALGIND